MRLLLPDAIEDQMKRELRAASSFEISSYAFVPETQYAEIATVSDQTSKKKKDWRGAGRAPLERMEPRRW